MKKIFLFFCLNFIFQSLSQDQCVKCEVLYEEKNFEDVIRIVKQLGDKASIGDLVYMGKSYQSLGDNKNAIKAYESILLTDDRNVEACVAVSALFIDIKNYENARFAAERALKFDKKNTKALYNLGVILYYEKKYEEFDSHVEKYIGDKECMGEFTYLKAITKLEQEKFDEALKALNNLESINSNFEFLSFYQGYCYFKLGKLEKAIEKLDKEAKLKSELSSEAYYYLAHTNIKLNNKVDACEAYTNAINLGDLTIEKEADMYCNNKKEKIETRDIRVKL